MSYGSNLKIVECKLHFRSTPTLAIFSSNLKIVECKCLLGNGFGRGCSSSNLKIVECKCLRAAEPVLLTPFKSKNSGM